MSGWISVHRTIKDHWLWEEKPFDNRSAWLDILLSAFHKTSKTKINGQIVEVDRGSFPTSERELADKWGWSKTKVRAFLKLLEDDSMITRKSDHKKTMLTVLNYSCYQDSETTEKPVKNQSETSERPVKDHSIYKNNKNNENNENNDNNISKKKDKSKKEKLPVIPLKEFYLMTNAEKESLLSTHGEVKLQVAEFVAVTNVEYERLISTHGEEATSKLIEILDNYKGSSGKTYSSDYRAILSWCIKRYQDDIEKSKKVISINSGKPQTQSNVQKAVSSINFDELEG